MHELGIIVQLVRTLGDIAREKHVSRISSVTLEVGELSGIVPDYFKDCWAYYRKKTPLIAGAELRVTMEPGVTVCQDCQQIYETVKYGKICPFCRSEQTCLLRGNELKIRQIEAE